MKGSLNQSFIFFIHNRIFSFAVNFVKSNEYNHETAFDPIFHYSPCTFTTILDQIDAEEICVPLQN